jgi:hypothetical protein
MIHLPIHMLQDPEANSGETRLNKSSKQHSQKNQRKRTIEAALAGIPCSPIPAPVGKVCKYPVAFLIHCFICGKYHVTYAIFMHIDC